jgi:hypothetical protein
MHATSCFLVLFSFTPSLLSLSLTLAHLLKHPPFTQYHRYFVLKTTPGMTVLVYYKSHEETDDEPQGSIPMDEVKSVDQVTGKTGRINVNIEGRMFELRADTDEEASVWIKKISKVLEIVFEQRKKNMETGDYRRPSFLPETPQETMRLMMDKSKASTYNSEATLEMMKKGEPFLRYKASNAKGGSTHKEVIMLFYQDDNTKMGSLYWCEPGDLTPSPDHCLPLHTLTDIYVGKQTEALKSALASNALPNRCCSLVGDVILNLQGDSKEQLGAWLFGINSILTTKGKKITEPSKKGAASAPAAAASPASATPKAAPKPPTSVSTPLGSSDMAPAPVFTANPVLAAPSKAAPASLAIPSETTSTGAGSSAAPARPPPLPQPQPEAAPQPQPQPIVVSSPTPIAEPHVSSPAPAGLVAHVPKKDKICEWLATLGSAFEAYGDIFVENGVDWDFLCSGHVGDDDLKELGVKPIHIKKMMYAIGALVPGSPAPAPASAPAPAYSAPSAPPPAPSMSSPTSYTAPPRAAPAPLVREPSAPVSAAANSMDNILAGIRSAKLQKSAAPAVASPPATGESIADIAARMAEARRKRTQGPN